MLEIIQTIVVGAFMLVSVIYGLMAMHPKFTITRNGHKQSIGYIGRMLWFVWCVLWALFWYSLIP